MIMSELHQNTPKQIAEGASSSDNFKEDGSSKIDQVFLQPHLLEQILDYAVHDRNTDNKLETLKAVRLVQKSWTDALGSLKHSQKECLFHLYLHNENSLEGTSYVRNRGKLLDQFVSSMESRIEEKVPPFCLTILKEFFRIENYDSLAACFRICGPGLQQLALHIPNNGGSLPGIFSNETLTSLRELRVGIGCGTIPGRDEAFNPGNATLLLASILTNNKTLENLKFVSKSKLLPPSFDYLRLPITLKTLTLLNIDAVHTLKLLKNNKLPCLENLVFCVNINESFEDGLFYGAMNNVKETLKDLYIEGEFYMGPPRTPNLVTFPVMAKLHMIRLSTLTLELDDGHPSTEKCFPKLTVIHLRNQTKEMLDKWISHDQKQIPNVKELNVRLSDDAFLESDDGYSISLNERQMVSIAELFVNVAFFSLNFNFTDIRPSVISCIFKNMRQLKSLSMTFDGPSQIQDSDFFDSILTGVPLDVIGTLKRNPSFWNNFQLKKEIPSLRDLTELNELSLRGLNGEAENGEPLISDFSFVFAFLEMPKLNILEFQGQFNASKRMTKKCGAMGKEVFKWKIYGKEMENRPYPYTG